MTANISTFSPAVPSNYKPFLQHLTEEGENFFLDCIISQNVFIHVSGTRMIDDNGRGRE